MNAHIASRLSVVMLHYGYAYNFSNYDNHYRVFQWLGLVMFATSFFGILKFMKVYIGMCNFSMAMLYYGYVSLCILLECKVL